MRRSTQIVLAAIGFIAGMLFAKLFGLPDVSLLVVCLAASVVAGLVLRRSSLLYVIVVVVSLLAGLFRQSLYSTSQSGPSIDDWQYRKPTVAGTVLSEPYYDSYKNYVFYLNNLTVNGAPIRGELRVKSLVGSAREGYRVSVVGKVMPSLGKASSQISYAKTTVLSTQVDPLTAAKVEFGKGMRRALPDPAASFMMGILLGARSTLPKDLQDVLSAIGLSHLVAVSGYNLTILALLAYRLFGKKWQWAGLVATLWLVAGFVVLTGSSPSIIRAGSMAALFMICSYYGRRLDVLACLALSVIITLGWDPSTIADLGWQLSFVSLAGIVLLTPLVSQFIPKRFGLIGEIAAVSIAAQLATLPLIAFSFGSVSVVSPLANILVLPLVPLMMMVGFAVGVVGILAPEVAYLVAQPVAWATNGLIDGMRYVASLPHASILNSAPNPGLLAAFYGLLVMLAIMGRARGLGSTIANDIITPVREEKAA